MYAIFESGGKQYRVKAGDVVDLEMLEGDAGSPVHFEKVLAVSDSGALNVGEGGTIEGAEVVGELIKQMRGPKLRVFKMKRRKGCRSRKGHRQRLSRVRIVDIKTAG